MVVVNDILPLDGRQLPIILYRLDIGCGETHLLKSVAVERHIRFGKVQQPLQLTPLELRLLLGVHTFGDQQLLVSGIDTPPIIQSVRNRKKNPANQIFPEPHTRKNLLGVARNAIATQCLQSRPAPVDPWLPFAEGISNDWQAAPVNLSGTIERPVTRNLDPVELA